MNYYVVFKQGMSLASLPGLKITNVAGWDYQDDGSLIFFKTLITGDNERHYNPTNIQTLIPPGVYLYILDQN